MMTKIRKFEKHTTRVFFLRGGVTFRRPMADCDDYILSKGITFGDPQLVNQQSITEPFGLSFISPPPLMKAGFQRVVGEINNPADGGLR
jgi:hypothetical protein